MKTINGPLDLTGDIIAFESGELDSEQVVELFQNLVNTGLAWQLQGSYGRTAAQLIKDGVISPGPVRLTQLPKWKEAHS